MSGTPSVSGTPVSETSLSEPDAPTGFVRAGRLADLEPNLPTGVVLENGERVCVVRRGDDVWAVHDVCPHRGFALGGGDVVGEHDGAPIVECPWHGAHFSCATGAVLHGPCTDDIPTFPVQVLGGVVFIGARRSAPGTEAA
jgi:nitrite reductase/ring-hydroxylating ferredoxin subunit